MREIVLTDLQLTNNLCFNRILNKTNEVHIFKSSVKISSIYETRELYNIYYKLEKYSEYCSFEFIEDKIIIYFK